jgi:hypothetical protein
MWIDNVLYRLSLVVANKNDESKNGVLNMMGSAPQRKALNVKQVSEDFDRFDQDGDDTADNPLDVSSTASDVSLKNVGYLMVPPTAVDNIDYILKVEVEYEQNSVQKTETLEYVLTPSSNGFLAGYKYNVNLTYPVFYDAELRSYNGVNYTKSLYTRVINAFINNLESKGIKTGVYGNLYMLTKGSLNDPSIRSKTIWVAQYYNKCQYDSDYIGWQYSSKGSIPGISGRVDVNIFNY